jgi:hypothetical protein
MGDRALFSLALIAAVGALGVAGCGGGDDTSTSASTEASGATGAGGPLTADQWATQADAICAQGDKDQNAAVQQYFQDHGIPTDKEPTDEQLQAVATDVVIPGIQSQIDAIKALPVPEDGADHVTGFVTQAQAELNVLKSDPSAISNAQAFQLTQKLARELGLKHCASG